MINGLFIAGVANQMAESNRAELAGERAARAAAEITAQNESFKFDIEKLFMITEALWAILREQNGYTDENLDQIIRNIDIRDGRLDGKAARTTERPACPRCGRTIMRKQMRCLYCGADAQHQAFDR